MPRNLLRLPNRNALAVAIAAYSLNGQLNAQEAVDAAGDSVDEEVVVIGQKFQNSLLNRLPIDADELPFSLDIIDESKLHERGYFNPLDALESVPNVTRSNTQYLPTGGSYRIRGLWATVLTNNRPENDSRGAGRRDSSQIERFEVLKGPVSILLGPVIPGGVVNQVTKSPHAEDSVELIARAGSFGTYRFEADLNEGALFDSEIFSGRLTLAYEDQGNSQDEANTETQSIRPVIEANFSDRTRAQLSVAYTEREGTPSSSFAVNEDGSIPSSIHDDTYFGVTSDQGGEDTYVDAEFQHEFLDDLKLVIRGSHQETDFDYQASQNIYNYYNGRGFGPDDTVGYVYYSSGYRDTEVSYGDVQLMGGFEAFGQRQDWVVGTSWQETSFASYWAFGGVLGLVDINDIPSAVYAVPNYDLELNPYRDREDELQSIYGEASLRPLEGLTVVAGIRYDDYEETNNATGETVPTDDTTFRLGATYQLTSGLNAYLSYAESFIPQAGTTRSGNNIKPETAVNYELGLKGHLFNERLHVTTAIFDLTRQNVATTDPNNLPSDPAYVIANGEQEHKGFEISAAIGITPDLHLDLAYGYLDAEITKVIDADIGQDVGDPVSMVPDETYSAYLSYELPKGALTGLKLGLGVRAISERPATRFEIEYDGYTLADAMAAYPINNALDVQLNIHNLFDEEYLDTAGYSTGTPGGGHRFGNPRSAFVSLRARF